MMAIVKDGYLDDYDIEALGGQAVDMLYPRAQIQIEALASGLAGTPRWGGMAINQGDPRRLIVTITAESRCTLRVDPQWTRPEALANLVEDLAQARGERFRGQWFPLCPGHNHRARVTLQPDEVMLICPAEGVTVARLVPELPA